MFGSHLSIAGGLENAVAEAVRLGLDCVQVFTRNQRRWASPPLAEEEIRRWGDALARAGWRDGDLPRVVSHNSYLVNLAAPPGENRTRSIAAQRGELERCEALGIDRCVIHPGAHLGAAPKGRLPLGEAPTPDEQAGIARIVEALDRIHRDLPGYRVRTLLETTVGSGTNLGGDFAHLAAIRERVREPQRIGFCFDTCHVVAAGWDMSTPRRAAAVLARFDELCGLDQIGAFHMNDSKGGVGSRLDRHTHIGEGTCGRACFRAICSDPRFARIPKILETPKEGDADHPPWDLVNVRILRAMARSRTATRRIDAVA
jgi:deoxyribonuclease-4